MSDPAEAMVAARLHALRVPYARHVATPRGRTCDFLVAIGDLRVALHVKRLVLEGAEVRPPPPSAIRSLARLRRAVVLGIWLDPNMDPSSQSRFARMVREFVVGASIGEECAMRDDRDRLLARCQIVGTWGGRHAVVAMGEAGDPLPVARRALRLLRRAREQYQPRVHNVTVLCAEVRALAGIERAVLGTPIERWDLYPPVGQRIAIGRDSDGFLPQRLNSSREAVVWLPFDSEARSVGRGRTWASAVGDKETTSVAEWLDQLVAPIRGSRRSSNQEARKSTTQRARKSDS